MKSETRRKLSVFVFMFLFVGAILAYAETLSPTLLDFPSGTLNIKTINLGGVSRDTWPAGGAGAEHDQDLNTTDAVTFASINTGQGANELYDMDQNVLTTSGPTFGTVDTGQGANELYDMDQNVLTTSNPVFDELTAFGLLVDWLELNGVNRSTWPTSSGAGIDEHPFSYLVFTNETGAYAINGSTGLIDSSGADHDVVISYAMSHLTSGRTSKELITLKGDFDIDSTVSPETYTVVQTFGTVTLSDDSNTHMLSMSGKTDIDIIGGLWDGNKEGQSSDCDVIYLTDTSDILISDVDILNAYRYGIGAVTTVDANLFLVIDGSKVENTTKQGIYFGARNSTIKNSVIIDTHHFGIYLAVDIVDGYNLIEGNYIINAGYGANYDGMKIQNNYNTIKGNFLFNNGRDGIDTIGCFGNIFDSNHFYNNGWHVDGGSGIHITGTASVGSKDVVVSNNVFRDNNASQISITGSITSAWNIQIVANMISGGTRGINSYGEAYGCLIADNIIMNSSMNGITLNGFHNGTIRDNIVKNSGYERTPPTYYDGINIDSSTYNLVVGNKCYDDQPVKTQYFGIDEESGADYNHITDNYVLGNDNIGIRVIGVNTIVNDNVGSIDVPADLVYTRTIAVPFVGGTTWNEKGNILGYNLTADTNYATTSFALGEINEVLRIKVCAVTWTSETEGMKVEFKAWGSQSGEMFNAETVLVADKTSVTTGMTIYNRVYWSFTSSDDSDMGDWSSSEIIYVQVLHEAAGGDDCATNGVFQLILIEYV